MNYSECNLLLARYIGATSNEPSEFQPIIFTLNIQGLDNRIIATLSEMKFQTDFNWIMTVVIKILSEKFEDGEKVTFRTFGQKDEDGKFMVRIERSALFTADSFQDALYKAIVDFVERKIS